MFRQQAGKEDSRWPLLWEGHGIQVDGLRGPYPNVKLHRLEVGYEPQRLGIIEWAHCPAMQRILDMRFTP